MKSKYVINGLTPGEFFHKYYLYMPMVEVPPFDSTKFVFKHGLENSPLPPKTTRKFKPKIFPTNIESLIEKFQNYNDGTYKIVFFINIAPEHGPEDNFADGIHNEMNNWFLEIMGKETPVLSNNDAYWSYKFSEVPGAGRHSLQATNRFKADILFNFISKKVLKMDEVKAELN